MPARSAILASCAAAGFERPVPPLASVERMTPAAAANLCCVASPRNTRTWAPGSSAPTARIAASRSAEAGLDIVVAIDGIVDFVLNMQETGSLARSADDAGQE